MHLCVLLLGQKVTEGGRDGNHRSEKIARGQHLEEQRQDLIYIDSENNHRLYLDEGNNEFDVKKQFAISAPPGMERVLKFKISDLERAEMTESVNGNPQRALLSKHLKDLKQKVRRSKRAVVLAKDRLKEMPLDRFTSSGDYVGDSSGDQSANRDFIYDDDDVYYNSGDDAHDISGKDADRNRKESNWNINEA